jgi:D-glycero-alpha-D-manno-heptose 1-phosphate guanylyltransferase
MAEKVEAQMGHQWRGASIAYSREDEPLGTGGAVRLATRHLLGSGALVTNGDTFMRFSPADLEQKVQALGVTMGIALAQVSDVSRYGAVDVVAGRVMALREKGGVHAGQINAGSYFLTPDAISALPQDKTFSFETEVLLPASRRGEVAALEGGRDFIDIGVPEDYARAQQLFAQCT